MRAVALVLVGMWVSGVLGCASESGPATRPGNSADRAQQDPFGYRPEFDKTDISGGGLSDFNRDGFKKDMNSVFNP